MEWNLNTLSGCCKIWMEDTSSGPFSLDRLSEHIQGRRTFWIADHKLESFYPRLLPIRDLMSLEALESAKNLSSIEDIYIIFHEEHLDKSSLVVAIGGGIITDMTGFAASTFKRGIPFAFVPSTLLAMVDAGLGGKNGVNLYDYKNMVGVIRQPEFVHIAPELLQTLPQEEFINGLAEVVKAACIQDALFFEFLESHSEAILKRQDETLRSMIRQAITIKVKLVQADDQEKNVRTLLNFGHTLGHALEKCTFLSHGEAVAIGCVMASKLSVQKGLLSHSDFKRIEGLFRHLGLPTQMPENTIKDCVDILSYDKKRHGNTLRWVLLAGIGQGVLHEMSLEESEQSLSDLDSDIQDELGS